MSAQPESIELTSRRGASGGGSRVALSWKLRIDGFDMAVLALFVVVSMWVLGMDLWRVVAEGRVWTGTDGLFLSDQMQYLAWIRSAAQHGLISDLFVLHDTPSDYLQPLVVLSALLTRLGVAVWLTLLLWKPAAVLGMFFAARAFVRSNLATRDARRAALLIALFGGWVTVIGDLWLGFWSWGYSFSLIGIAAAVAAIPAYAAVREGHARLWLPAVLGALAGWLHPWQGETLVLIVIGAEAALWATGDRRPPELRCLLLPAVTIAATVLPMLYYVVLAHADAQWGMARMAGKHAYGLTRLMLALAPLLLASALAYRRWPRGFVPIATRLWLPVAFVVFVVSESGISATPLHAFAGITVPLGVLSVEGVLSVAGRPLRRRPIVAAVLVAVAIIPATVAQLRVALLYAKPTLADANFIARDERRALDYLADDPEPGGVLSRNYLSLITPALTGRHSYLGSCQWSEPACGARQQVIFQIFEGSGIPDQVLRSDVLATHARFVLNSTCWLPGKDLDGILAPIASEVRRFGCATLYVLRDPQS
jgi:hypothetical protein